VSRAKLQKKRTHRRSAANAKAAESAACLLEERDWREFTHSGRLDTGVVLLSLVGGGRSVCGGRGSFVDGIAAENLASSSLGRGVVLERASEGTFSSRGSILLIL
jgi:hypothetical protein